MTWDIVPFQPIHARSIQLQRHQAGTLSVNALPYIDQLAALGPAFTALVVDRVVACAGITLQPFSIGTLWSLISADAKPYFWRLHKAAERLISIPRLRRLEASSEAEFVQGCRWLELLRFEREGLLRAFGPDGKDHVRYARIWLGSSR